MSVWTTSTTGLETALAAAIGSTLQQHTNTITNNLKGQQHILHIGNSVGTASVASNLHHLHHNSGSNNNININHLQHHLHHGNSSHSKYMQSLNINWTCCYFFFKSLADHNNIQQSFLNRSAGICSNHSKVTKLTIIIFICFLSNANQIISPIFVSLSLSFSINLFLYFSI